jgi:hypothetical protein
LRLLLGCLTIQYSRRSFSLAQHLYAHAVNMQCTWWCGHLCVYLSVSARKLRFTSACRLVISRCLSSSLHTNLQCDLAIIAHVPLVKLINNAHLQAHASEAQALEQIRPAGFTLLSSLLHRRAVAACAQACSYPSWRSYHRHTHAERKSERYTPRALLDFWIRPRAHRVEACAGCLAQTMSCYGASFLLCQASGCTQVL